MVDPTSRVRTSVPDEEDGGTGLGGGAELIFVEGRSTDGTCAAIEREIAKHPERPSALIRQRGEGKGEFINGARLVHSMEHEAMRPANVDGASR